MFPCVRVSVWANLSFMEEDPYATPKQSATPPPLQRPPGELADNLGIRMLIPVGRSIWAIAAGYLGLFSFLILPAPISLVVSIIALRDIRKSRESGKVKHGNGRAFFGLVMGILGTMALVAILVLQFLE